MERITLTLISFVPMLNNRGVNPFLDTDLCSYSFVPMLNNRGVNPQKT